MTWLITAFEEFGGAKSNSALRTLERSRALESEKIRFFSPVPVNFSAAWSAVRAQAEKISNLKGILCLGQAEWRMKISLEKMAINWIDARIPDNAGAQPKNQKVEASAPDLLWSPIPWEKMPPHPNIEVSNFAGNYLCNSLMFQVLQWCQAQRKFGGFVHFPLLASQREEGLQTYLPRMADEDAAEGFERIVEFLLRVG